MARWSPPTRSWRPGQRIRAHGAAPDTWGRGGAMSFYTQALRPALFQLPPDRSHHLAQVALRWAPPWKLLSALQGLSHSVESLRTEFAGVTLRNPVRLAAAFHKHRETAKP